MAIAVNYKQQFPVSMGENDIVLKASSQAYSLTLYRKPVRKFQLESETNYLLDWSSRGTVDDQVLNKVMFCELLLL